MYYYMLHDSNGVHSQPLSGKQPFLNSWIRIRKDISLNYMVMVWMDGNETKKIHLILIDWGPVPIYEYN